MGCSLHEAWRSASTPIVTTVAPTMPVLAARSAPTTITDIPRPLVRFPRPLAMAVSSSSAILARSKVTPIRIKSGTAIRVSFVIVPNIRPDSAATKLASKCPAITPTAAKSSAVPASVSATGSQRAVIRRRCRTVRVLIHPQPSVGTSLSSIKPWMIRLTA